MSNTIKNEETGIRILEECLEKSPSIHCKIDKCDKNIAYDGEIEFYNITEDDENFSSKNYAFSCKVQVKAVNQLKSRKYPIKVDHLKIYKNNGGVLYFVIDLATKKIYHIDLLPIYISKHIDGKENQKSISFKLKQFPEISEKMEGLLIEFNHNSKMESSTNGKLYTLDEISIESGLTIRGSIPVDKKNGCLVLSNKILYLTVQKAEVYRIGVKIKNINEIILTLKNEVFSWGKSNELKADVKFAVDIDGNYFVIEDQVKVYFGGKKKGNFNYHFQSNLTSVKKCIAILKAIFSGNTIRIGQFFEFNVEFQQECCDDIGRLEEQVAHLEAIIRYFGIRKEIRLESFSAEDFGNIEVLYHSLVENEPHEVDGVEKSHAIRGVKIGDLMLGLIYFIKIENGKALGQYLDLFNPNIFVKRKNSVSFPYYMVINDEKLHELDNINYKNILFDMRKRCKDIIDRESVKTDKEKLSCSEEEEHIFVNMLLSWLKVYDRNNNKALLDILVEVSEALYSKIPLGYIYINYLQTIRRRRRLQDNEIHELEKWKKEYESGGNHKCELVAIALLLEERHTYERLYGELSEDEKRSINEYPITKIKEINKWANDSI